MKFKSILTIALLALIISSCNKDEEECVAEIENSGLIEEAISFKCDNPYYHQVFVINSDAELEELRNENSGCNQPDIDFENFTLLGMYAYGEGTTSYYRSVEADTANLRYNYKITVETCGNCDCLNDNMNWVLVPKLNAEWTVRFVKDGFN